MNLDELISAAADNMTSDLRRKLISHPGELGTAREQIIRDFLTAHLPKRFEVSTGFVFDCRGNVSRQLDIVVFDANSCPRFEIPGGKFLFPCEAVVAVGQVKSKLTSRDDFRSAIDNLASVKSLDRSANGTAFDSHFNELLSPTDNHLHQMFTFIFVTGESLSPETMAQSLLDYAFEIPIEHLPNIVLALDHYLVTYCCDSGICPNPMVARGVAVQTSTEPNDVLLRFYLLLGQALNVIRTASLPFWEYLSKYRDLPAAVFHSCVESPPPYLGQWTRGR